jgi:hypothetical protein
MDCEKFDQHVIDALCDELDELTTASMKRHMEGCSRCASAFSALRATREVAILPLEEPSDELESRILFAASAAQRKTPWHRKALRALAWAGSHAMRPQLAMAAVFVLVIGSSLLLLRAKPGTTSIGPVSVTERGEPSPDRDEGAAQMAAAPTAVAAAGDQPPSPPAGEAAPGRGDGKDSGQDREKQEDAKPGKAGDAQSALADAKATEGASGCDAALPKYEDVGVRYPGTSQAVAAMWAAAACHKKNGNADKAKELYGVLAKRDEYRAQAEEALNELSPMNNSAAQATAVASASPATPAATASQAPGGAGHAGAAAGAKAAAAPPKAAAPAKPVTNSMEYKGDPQAPGGAGSRGNAAPIRRRAIDSAF